MRVSNGNVLFALLVALPEMHQQKAIYNYYPVRTLNLIYWIWLATIYVAIIYQDNTRVYKKSRI